MREMLLQNIPAKIDRKKLLSSLHLKEETEDGQRVLELAHEAEKIANPKGLARVADIDSKHEDKVVIEGITFPSRVMAINLKDAYRVFPFVATCGRELEQWAKSLPDFLEQFWATQIQEIVLQEAHRFLQAYLKQEFQIKKLSSMNPGSLGDWPMEEQRKLFTLLGDTYQKVGVELTESFLMVPMKSISGIFFPTQVDFENCQLCSRSHCPGRRAPFNPELLQEKYKLDKKLS
ncbi:MAG: hypothetical protein PWP04_542 [Candidatus Atribacteria bacterium]|nr:hypothetical protein [Candidatus Atribacteria bacterium]